MIPGQRIGTETRLRAGRSRIQIPAETSDFSHLQVFQTDPGAHPASC